APEREDAGGGVDAPPGQPRVVEPRMTRQRGDHQDLEPLARPAMQDAGDPYRPELAVELSEDLGFDPQSPDRRLVGGGSDLRETQEVPALIDHPKDTAVAVERGGCRNVGTARVGDLLEERAEPWLEQHPARSEERRVGKEG